MYRVEVDLTSMEMTLWLRSHSYPVDGRYAITTDKYDATATALDSHRQIRGKSLSGSSA